MMTMKEYEQELTKSVRRGLMKEYEDRGKELGRINRISDDILHILEGSEKLNAAQFCMIAIALRKVYRIRRVIKKRQITVKAMLEKLDQGGTIEEVKKIGYKEENGMKGNILKYYNLRYLKSKDTKSMPILAQVDDALERAGLKKYENDYTNM